MLLPLVILFEKTFFAKSLEAFLDFSFGYLSCRLSVIFSSYTLNRTLSLPVFLQAKALDSNSTEMQQRSTNPLQNTNSAPTLLHNDSGTDINDIITIERLTYIKHGRELFRTLDFNIYNCKIF